MSEFRIRAGDAKSGEPSGTNEADPERMLACAVLERAIADLHTRSSDLSYIKNQNDARSFLTETVGAWAQCREFWVTLAGIDHDAFYEKVKRRFLDPDGPMLIRRSGQHRMGGVAE